MKYFGGCDVGSTYTKTVILDENGAIVAANTIKSKINSAQSAKAGLDQAIADAGLKEISDLTYLIGTGYGRNKVPQADENISEISCHAMGVHVTDPSVRAIIDIGGQDVKGIAVDTDGTVKTFAMNDKCAAGTGRFFESMANAFEMSLEEFSKLSLTAENVIPITGTVVLPERERSDGSVHCDRRIYVGCIGALGKLERNDGRHVMGEILCHAVFTYLKR